MMFPGTALETIYATVTNVTNQLVDDGFTADLGFANGVHMIVEVGTSNFINLPRWYVLGRDGTAMIKDWGENLKIVRACGTDEEDVVPVRTAAGLTKTMARGVMTASLRKSVRKKRAISAISTEM